MYAVDNVDNSGRPPKCTSVVESIRYMYVDEGAYWYERRAFHLSSRVCSLSSSCLTRCWLSGVNSPAIHMVTIITRYTTELAGNSPVMHMPNIITPPWVRA